MQRLPTVSDFGFWSVGSYFILEVIILVCHVYVPLPVFVFHPLTFSMYTRVALVYHYCIFKPVFPISSPWPLVCISLSFFPLGTFLCLPWWHLGFWTSVYLSAYHSSSLFVPQPSVGVFGDGLLMVRSTSQLNPPFYIGQNREQNKQSTSHAVGVSSVEFTGLQQRLSTLFSLSLFDRQTRHTAHLTSGYAARSDATGEQTSEGSVGCEVFKSDDESNLEDKQ